ncbi:hypothetical protein FAGAP_11816 [Fusarium agapanthi]|uniref:DUF6604 domain-containing protein n=1 Tax=Fusarium agapanthi TaxID=1803897 RepID=A0A9P5AYD1_9HYPO|nr:hypothetical protein FAGAP_11816 [Fusarium agapanthi]
MLSPAYMSIYQQYKADTDSVATWLANTAKAHGYDAEASLGGAAADADAAKKKKNKKKKKGSGKGKGPSRAKNKVRDFEAMAKHVADTNAIEVPHRTAVALERGIWVRRSFSQKLAESGARRDHRSDATHSHFVQVLEKVRDYLKPIMEAGLFKPDELDKKSDDKTDKSAKGMFNVLNVYTPSEEFLNAPDITPAPASEPQYTVEEEVTWEDALIAFMSLLRDYEILSKGIRSLWEKYASGQLELAAVLVATNITFEFANTMEKDIQDVMDKFGGTPAFSASYFQSLCEEQGIKSDKKKRGDPFDLEAYGLAKIFFINTTSVLERYLLNAGPNPSSYKGASAWYDEKLGGGGEFEDELIRGIGACLKDKSPHPPFWMSWAFQIYLDIVQGLGENVGRGYEDMKQASLKIQKALLQVDQTPGRTTVLQTVTRWIKDPIFMANQDLVMAANTSSSSNKTPEFQFLRRNPLHCGILLHHMRCMLHGCGVQTAAYSGGLMCTTQLYHALRQEGYVPKDQAWEDLEEFWGYQGNPCFFVGDPPKDREGYFRNYTLCLGTSVTNWAPNRRNIMPTENKKNARNMKFDAWTSMTLHQRLRVKDPREPWTTADVEGLLTQGRGEDTLDGKRHVQAAFKKKAQEANLEAVPKTPSGQIEQVAQVVNEQIPRIAFNYFTMHTVAWSLLTDLKRAFSYAIGPEFLHYVPNENLLPYVVGYVFATAAGRGGLDVRQQREGNERLFDTAGDVLLEFLNKGKGRVIREAQSAEVSEGDVEHIDVDGSDQWEHQAFEDRYGGERYAANRYGRNSGGWQDDGDNPFYALDGEQLMELWSMLKGAAGRQ